MRFFSHENDIWTDFQNNANFNEIFLKLRIPLK
jgi:hypothetical protein